jgi:exopolyphosphatase/guanosine-5'-triphosphate,3'-diphosphate pyrophosphatase
MHPTEDLHKKVKYRRIAVIDCGTNTFNLRIVDILPGVEKGFRPWTKVFSLRLAVRLGKGGIGKGVIRPDRIARGLDAIGVMREAMRNYQTDEVFVIATSALRDASNNKVFTEGVQKLYGYHVQIISGATEASLIQEGIALTYSPSEGETVLTLDIGGGSTECVIWNRQKVVWARSFDVGVARLQALFKLSDRFGEDAYEKMKPYLDDMLAPLALALSKTNPSVILGSSGSFDTFYSLTKPKSKNGLNAGKDKHRNDAKQKIKCHPSADVIDVKKFDELADILIRNTLKDRLNMSGMPPDRADLIPYASAIVKWIQNETEITHFYRSKYAVREGVLARIVGGDFVTPGLTASLV